MFRRSWASGFTITLSIFLVSIIGNKLAADGVAVVDFSPDTVGTVSSISSFNSYLFPLTVGDSFTLNNTYSIDCASIFSSFNAQVAVGSILEVAIFDSNNGAPGALIHSELAPIVSIDTSGTLTDTSLSRKTVNLAQSLILGPGDYFFTMPGVNVDPEQATSFPGFQDSGVWVGYDANPDLEGGFSDMGDMLFQLDGTLVVPEPTSAGLFVVGAIGCLLHRRRL